MRQLESNLQTACATWFNLQYPQFSAVFFAVPNGGSRNVIEAKRLKREGVKSGVSDLILLVANNKYYGLCIEMKVGKNKQSEHQKEFQEAVEKQGYYYTLCYSVVDFMQIIKDYFADKI